MAPIHNSEFANNLTVCRKHRASVATLPVTTLSHIFYIVARTIHSQVPRVSALQMYKEKNFHSNLVGGTASLHLSHSDLGTPQLVPAKQLIELEKQEAFNTATASSPAS